MRWVTITGNGPEVESSANKILRGLKNSNKRFGWRPSINRKRFFLGCDNNGVSSGVTLSKATSVSVNIRVLAGGRGTSKFTMHLSRSLTRIDSPLPKDSVLARQTALVVLELQRIQL